MNDEFICAELNRFLKPIPDKLNIEVYRNKQYKDVYTYEIGKFIIAFSVCLINMSRFTDIDGILANLAEENINVKFKLELSYNIQTNLIRYKIVQKILPEFDN